MAELVFKRPDGTERKVMGYRAAKPREGAKKYNASKIKQEDLPAKVDLRPHMTTIENQGSTSSCVANAVAGAYEYLVKKHLGEEAYEVSRMFIYYNARYIGEIEGDEGCIVQDAIEGLKEYGACSEETWEFDENIVNEEPSEEAYEEAANFLVESVEHIPLDMYSWKHALAEGNPIIFGMSLFDSFDKQKKKGLVPVPSDKETSRESHAGHSMLCVGYSDKEKLFIVRNSWGKSWGDKGYCYIPYDYLINPKFNDGDSWIIKRLDNFEIDQDTWTENEEDCEDMVEDVSTEISNMSDQDYKEMVEAMGTEYPLEFRIGLIVMYAAYQDEEISDEEREEIASYLEKILKDVTTTELDAEAILELAEEECENEDLVYESVELLGEYLSAGTLAKIVSQIQEIVEVDDLAEDEENFVYELIEAWEIEEGEQE